jgi:hypothetical protein
MSGVNKAFKKVHDFHTWAPKKLLGKKLSDQLHPLGTANEKMVTEAKDAKTSAKEAAALQEQLAKQQANELANLNDEENRRIKKLIMGGRGTRGYRGSPLLRAAPGNSAGRAASAGGASGVAAANFRDAGARGGLQRGGMNVALS